MFQESPAIPLSQRFKIEVRATLLQESEAGWPALFIQIMDMKTCFRCGLEKESECFYPNPRTKTGLTSWCKSCYSEVNILKREEKSAYDAKYWIENKTTRQPQKADWHKRNRPKSKAKRNSYDSTYQKQRYSFDVDFKLRKILRQRIRSALKNMQKTGSAVRNLGCTIPELRTHLESKFQPGMTWNNWGMGDGKWNIDHIMPLAAFDLTNIQHFVLACHYLNLQPLWHKENQKKSDKRLSFE